MENVQPRSKRSPEELFNKFFEAEDCGQILHAFQRLVNLLGVRAESPREFYQCLKGKLQSWKCKSLWELLDNRANHKDYEKGKSCDTLQVLVIGAGPIGLRTAIEMALLGAQVVVVEKRTSFSRNNVLHLWPFLIDDFRSLGAKRFYGKFCSGTINHISIRRLQSIFLKTALIFGVKVFTGVTFEEVLEPANDDEGWKCHVTPDNHPINEYEIDVIIGADGKKNVLPGFAQIEMRGSLAIGITANFVNHFTEAEKNAEEISGIAYQFNPAFFDKLYQQKKIKLENIVYYKDETHYFVMTATKASLLERGVIIKDIGNPALLLAPENIHQEELMKYVVDTVHYATKGQLNSFEFKMTDRGQPDVAAFDFTSIKKAENSARIRERKGSKLLIGLVGDSLLEPFWPTGSGCARGVLSSLDAAWMVRSFASDKPPLQILSERENIYRLLSGTSNENLSKNFVAYSINPSTRYTHIPHRKLEEVYHLYDTDDPVNADFSLGSPPSYLGNKSVKKRTISTGAKPTMGKNRNRVKFSTELSVEQYSANSSCSSLDDLTSPRPRAHSEELTSGGEEISDVSKKGKKKSKKWKKSRASTSPEDVSEGRSSKTKRRFLSKKHKVTRTKSSPAPEPTTPEVEKEKHSRKRSFFGFGRSHKAKNKAGRKSPRLKEEVIQAQSNVYNVEEGIAVEGRVESQGPSRKWSSASQGKTQGTHEEAVQFQRNTGEGTQNELVPFKRDSLRRSARDIIAEMNARDAKIAEETSAPPSRKRPMRKSLTTGNLKKPLEAMSSNETERNEVKRAASDLGIRTPPPKQAKQESLWDAIASLSPRRSEQAVPVLSQMSPEADRPDVAPHPNVSSVVRMAAMLAMATPLLIDDRRPIEDSRLTKLSASGHVRSAISRFNTMDDFTPSLKSHRNPARPRTLNMEDDSVDMSDGRKEKSERDWQPTALAFVEGKSKPTILEVAETRHRRLTKQESLEACQKLLEISKRFALLDDESTDSPAPAQKERNTKIYQKTFIASLEDKGEQKDDKKDSGKPDNTNDSSKKGPSTPNTDRSSPSQARQSLAFGSPEIRHMEKLMENLTETLPKERAHASLRFLISIFRRIQKDPKDDRFRRIYKSRVKFKKFVWTVRNAKQFMYTSGWQEVGSFLVFPLTKGVDEPLAVLMKYQETLEESSPSLLKPVAQMRSSRGSSSLTPSTSKSIKTDTAIKKQITTTPVRSASEKKTPRKKILEKKRATTPKSLPLDRVVRLNQLLSTPKSPKVEENPEDITWDLQMEDPLVEASVSRESGRFSTTSSDMSDINFVSNMHLTPLGISPLLPVSPDPAIMEEIDGLSNTLDDLIMSLDDLEPEFEPEFDNKENNNKIANSGGSNEYQALHTTLDYLLDSDEEEEFTRDVSGWTSVPNILEDYDPAERRPSAFVRVSSLKSAKEIQEFQAKQKQSAEGSLRKSVLDGGDKNTEKEMRRTSSDKGPKGKRGGNYTVMSGLQSKNTRTRLSSTRDSQIPGSVSKSSGNDEIAKTSRSRASSSSSSTSRNSFSKTTSVAASKATAKSALVTSSGRGNATGKESGRNNPRKSSSDERKNVGLSAVSPSALKASNKDSGLRSGRKSSRDNTASSDVTSSVVSDVASSNKTSKPPSTSGNSRKKESLHRKLPTRPDAGKAESSGAKDSRETRARNGMENGNTGAANSRKAEKENKVKGQSRPPSGQSRSKKRQDITTKLDGLESGFESLRNSPLSKAGSERASRPNSVSSIDSNTSRVSASSKRMPSRPQSVSSSVQSAESSADEGSMRRARKGSNSSVASNTRSKTKLRSGAGARQESRSTSSKKPQAYPNPTTGGKSGAKTLKEIAMEGKRNDFTHIAMVQGMDENVIDIGMAEKRNEFVTERRKGKRSAKRLPLEDHVSRSNLSENETTAQDDSFDSIAVTTRNDFTDASINDTQQQTSRDSGFSGSWTKLSNLPGCDYCHGDSDREVSSGSLSSFTSNGDIKMQAKGNGETASEIIETSPVEGGSLVDSGYNSQLGRADEFEFPDEGIQITNNVAVNSRNHTYPIKTLEERRSNVLEAAKESAKKKKTKATNERRSILKIRSQSAENLVWGKKKNFEQHELPGRSATIDTASAAASKKKGKFSFHLRKKGTGSCSDISIASIPEESEPGYEICAKNLQNARENGLVSLGAISKTTGKDDGNLSVSPSKGKNPLKKISPFRLHAKSK